jgi:two-component system, chemotaxis family, response regulator WspF
MRIAIAHADATHLHSLDRLIQKEGGYQLAWLARNTAEVLERVAADRPDLLLMDLDLPENAVHAMQRLMAENACPILILTRTDEDQTARIFEALGAGAIDVIATPEHDAQSIAGITPPLLTRVQAISRLQNPGHDQAGSGTGSLVVVGASAGGPPALAHVLSGLPAGFPAAVLIVQHIDSRFVTAMASWLQTNCRLPVRTAADGDSLVHGTVLLAGGLQHLTLTARGRLRYSAGPCRSPYQHAVDALFESVAAHWTGKLAGVLLTGMGHDGANGLKLLRNARALTIAQDEASSAVYGMPKAAADLGAAVAILPLKEIAPRLITYFKTPNSTRIGRRP